MLPFRLKNLNPIIKKKIKNKFFENQKFDIKQKRISESKKIKGTVPIPEHIRIDIQRETDIIN